MAEKKTMEYYLFYDLNDEVEKSLGFDIRDCGKHFYPDTTSFDQWHKDKGYPETDSEGKHMNSSQIWFAEFKRDIAKGKIKKVPYLDFWHWQMDHCFGTEVRNDTYNTLYVGMDEDYIGEMEPWQSGIQQKFHDLFYHLSDEGWINVYISW